MTTLMIIYGVLISGLLASLIRNREKTKYALVFAGKNLLKTAPSLLAVLGIVGLTLGFLTPESISKILGQDAGVFAPITAAILGAITLIPSIIAFPLAGSLFRSGASIMTVSAFITSLVMVGLVTAPLEAKALGVKFTVLRNGLGFAAALVIASIMGALL